METDRWEDGLAFAESFTDKCNEMADMLQTVHEYRKELIHRITDIVKEHNDDTVYHQRINVYPYSVDMATVRTNQSCMYVDDWSFSYNRAIDAVFIKNNNINARHNLMQLDNSTLLDIYKELIVKFLC